MYVTDTSDHDFTHYHPLPLLEKEGKRQRILVTLRCERLLPGVLTKEAYYVMPELINRDKYFPDHQYLNDAIRLGSNRSLAHKER